jgi:hypothetical protein
MLQLDEARGLGRPRERHRRAGDETRHHVALRFAKLVGDEARELAEQRCVALLRDVRGGDDAKEWHFFDPLIECSVRRRSRSNVAFWNSDER